MLRSSLIALLLGYAIAGGAWFFAYGPGKAGHWTPLAAGLGFAAALFVALGLWILAAIGTGLAIAQNEACRTLPGFCVFALSTLSSLTVIAAACYYLR
jgi:hypothetical protein